MNASVSPLLTAAKQPFTFLLLRARGLFAAPKPYPDRVQLADGRVFRLHNRRNGTYRRPGYGKPVYQIWASLWPQLSDETRAEYGHLAP